MHKYTAAPVERQVQPFLQLLAHEGHGTLPVGRAHAPGSARRPQLIISQVVQTLLLDYSVITLDQEVTNKYSD